MRLYVLLCECTTMEMQWRYITGAVNIHPSIFCTTQGDLGRLRARDTLDGVLTHCRALSHTHTHNLEMEIILQRISSV